MEIIVAQKSILNFLIKNDSSLKENILISKTLKILDDMYKEAFDELVKERYATLLDQLKTRVLNDE